MAAIPERADPTLDAVDRALEMRAALERARPYLGLSGLGDACGRRVWLRFRWANAESWDALILKRFEDGHRTEALWIERLRLVEGVEVLDTDPVTGHQWGVLCARGHGKGHLDAAIVGILQAPATWHVFEAKCSEQKTYDKLAKAVATFGEKLALRNWNYTYWVQAQSYMHLTGMTRHYLLCSLPGGRGRPITVRTDYDKAESEKLMALAERLVFQATPPERIGPATFFECKWCSKRGLCHGQELPDRNCRTCLHSSPVDGGEWKCAKFGHLLSEDDQRAGCPSQRFIPDLVPWTQIDVCGSDVVYRKADGAEWVDRGV